MNKKLKIGIAVIAVLVIVFFVYRNVVGVQAVVVDSSAQGQKIREYADPSAFITPLELKTMMDEGADVVIIGALNPAKGDSPIAGSFTMWRDDYSADSGSYDFGGMRNTKGEMEEILSSYGATPASTIVTYAANSHHDAARLWWQVTLLGHKDVRFLDGGLNAWTGAGYPTGSAIPSVERTNYTAPAYSEALLADFDMVKAALDMDDWVIIDTRTTEEEDGSSTKSGAFGPGKIPQAVHINWTRANNEDTTLLSLAELRDLYGSTIEGKTVITYCQSGVRSAHTLLVLMKALGAADVYNYDGSWIEWSYVYYEQGDTTLPIENAAS